MDYYDRGADGHVSGSRVVSADLGSSDKHAVVEHLGALTRHVSSVTAAPPCGGRKPLRGVCGKVKTVTHAKPL